MRELTSVTAPRRLNRGGVVLSAIVLALILVATLTPSSGYTSSEFWCIACGEYGGLDVLDNIVMFMPLGFALAVATNWRWRSILACVALTLFIEMMQIRVVAGRDASLSDLLSNSLGGIIGVELSLRRRLLFRPRGRAAFRLAICGAALFALITSLTSVGLRPATIPRSLWVQWTPERASYFPFSGQLLEFKLDSIDLPRRFYPPASLGVDRVLRGPTWSATAAFTTVNLQPRPQSVIARIAEEFTVLVSLEQFGWDLACQQKTRSSDFRFRSPKIVLRDVLTSSTPSAPIRVRFTCSRAGPLLVAATDEKTDTLRLSPSLGWLLLFPYNLGMTSQYAWLGALWLFALAFPAGYWIRFLGDDGGGSTRPGWTAASRAYVPFVTLGLSFTIGLLVVPLVAGTAPAAWWEWAGGGLGVIAGSVSAWLASTFEARWLTRGRGPAATPVSDTLQ